MSDEITLRYLHEVARVLLLGCVVERDRSEGGQAYNVGRVDTPPSPMRYLFILIPAGRRGYLSLTMTAYQPTVRCAQQSKPSGTLDRCRDALSTVLVSHQAVTFAHEPEDYSEIELPHYIQSGA